MQVSVFHSTWNFLSHFRDGPHPLRGSSRRLDTVQNIFAQMCRCTWMATCIPLAAREPEIEMRCNSQFSGCFIRPPFIRLLHYAIVFEWKFIGSSQACKLCIDKNKSALCVYKNILFCMHDENNVNANARQFC